VLLPALRAQEYGTSCLNEQHPQIAIATLRDGPRTVCPPVDICRGTSPSQAPKSLPLENASPLPIAAIVAVEMIGPMPGTVSGVWLRHPVPTPSSCSDKVDLVRHGFDAPIEIAPVRAKIFDRLDHAGRDSLSVMVRIMGISVRSARSPWRTAMPRSSRKARDWLITLGAGKPAVRARDAARVARPF
jgi:hypothetical protein